MKYVTSFLVITALSASVLVGLKSSALNFTQLVDAEDLQIASSQDRLIQELDSPDNPLVQQGQLLTNIAKLTTPAVVHIQAESENSKGGSVEETGSGVIVISSKAPGFFVITNRHVILNAELEDIAIHLSDGREVNPVRLWTDRATDIAVMKLDVKGVRSARWGNSEKVEIGDMVLAMGSPFGLSQSVTFGIISAKGRRSLQLGAAVLNQDFLQTDAAINPGNSGGPLIDMQGRVIGINTAIASNSGGNDGIGFSIPSQLVLKVVEDMLEFGYVKRAYLGVKLDPQFNAKAAKRFHLDRVKGTRVVEVYANTPAESAGIQINDIILSFDGKDIMDENHLINLVSLTPVGSKANLVVLRSGRKRMIVVHLADRTKREKKRSELPSTIEGHLRVEPTSFQVHHFNKELAEQIGLRKFQQGLLVLSVKHHSQLTGELLPGDLILKVAGKRVTSIDALQSLLAQHNTTKSLLIKIGRPTPHGDLETRIIIWRRK